MGNKNQRKKRRKNLQTIVKVKKRKIAKKNKMGSSSSKVAISSLKVLSKKETSKNTKNLVLNPRLCQSIFHATEGFCCEKEFQPFKKFLLSDSNLKPATMSKKKVLENELIKVIDLPHSETKLLSPGAANHLE